MLRLIVGSIGALAVVLVAFSPVHTKADPATEWNRDITGNWTFEAQARNGGVIIGRLAIDLYGKPVNYVYDVSPEGDIIGPPVWFGGVGSWRYSAGQLQGRLPSRYQSPEFYVRRNDETSWSGYWIDPDGKQHGLKLTRNRPKITEVTAYRWISHSEAAETLELEPETWSLLPYDRMRLEGRGWNETTLDGNLPKITLLIKGTGFVFAEKSIFTADTSDEFYNQYGKAFRCAEDRKDLCLTLGLRYGIQPGEKTLIINGEEVRFRLDFADEVAELAVNLLRIDDSKPETIHLFSGEQNEKVSLLPAFTPREANPIYRLRFRVSGAFEEGKITVENQDVAAFLNPSFAAAARDPNDLVYRSFEIKSYGITTVHITASSNSGQRIVKTFQINAAPFDLDIAGIPEAYEENPGGITKYRSLSKLIIRVGEQPPNWIEEVILSPSDGEPVNLYLDPEKNQKVEKPSWPVNQVPRELYVEGKDVSTSYRGIRLRLGVRSFGIEFVDTVRLTVVGIEVLPENGELFLGVNDNDDNQNNLKDFDEIGLPVSNEADLHAVVAVRPIVPELSIRVSPGFSIWRSPNKGEDALVHNGLSKQGGVIADEALDPDVTTYFVEALTPGLNREVAFTVETDRYFETQTGHVAEPVTASVKLNAVKADIDISGLPDEGDAEYRNGGIVEVVRRKNIDILDFTELQLRVSPLELDPRGHITLSVDRGLQLIAIWHETAEFEVRKLEFEKETDESDSGIVEFSNIADLPKNIWIQGLKTDKENNVEISLSYWGTTPIHKDRIRLTVVDKRKIEKLTLEPSIIVVPHDPSGTHFSTELEVTLDTEDETDIDVHDHPETEYEWINAGVANTFSPDIPIADIEVNSDGLLKIKSSGVQLLKATHRDVESNYSILFAGLSLKSIKLEPESVVSGAVGAFVENPWLVLTTDNSSWFADKGYVHLTDIVFAALDSSFELSATEIVEATNAIGSKLGPQAKVFIQVLKFLAPVAGTQFLDFRSNNDTIVTVSDDRFSLKGYVQAQKSGIAGITGTLDLAKFSLGEASDTVISWVLPEITDVEVARPSDPVDDHTEPIELIVTEPRKPGLIVRAWATGKVSSDSRVQYTGHIQSILANEFQPGPVDLELEIAGFKFRITGTITDETRKGGGKELAFKEMRTALYVPNGLADWSTNSSTLAQVEEKSNQLSIDAHLLRNDQLLTGSTRIWVSVSVPGMTSEDRPVVSPLRQVELIDTVCRAGNPVFHLGEFNQETLIDLSSGFDTVPIKGVEPRPFEAALSRVKHPLAKLPAGGDRRTGVFLIPSTSKIGPWSAGWIYFVEFPINDPNLCDAEFQESAILTDDNGGDVRNKPLIKKAGDRISKAYGKFFQPREPIYKYALIFADVRGWQDNSSGILKLDRFGQRISVIDKSSSEYRSTALWYLNLGFDSRRSPSELPKFAGEVVGSSGGQVDATFKGSNDVDALQRFSGIAVPF